VGRELERRGIGLFKGWREEEGSGEKRIKVLVEVEREVR
jgi:hypothetical protein